MPDPRPIEPRPLHNRDGTILSLARQMTYDIDREAATTTVPTATLLMMLARLCEALQMPAPQINQPAVRNMFTEAATSQNHLAPENNPNLAFWRQAADRDEERAGPDEPAED